MSNITTLAELEDAAIGTIVVSSGGPQHSYIPWKKTGPDEWVSGLAKIPTSYLRSAVEARSLHRKEPHPVRAGQAYQHIGNRQYYVVISRGDGGLASMLCLGRNGDSAVEFMPDAFYASGELTEAHLTYANQFYGAGLVMLGMYNNMPKVGGGLGLDKVERLHEVAAQNPALDDVLEEIGIPRTEEVTVTVHVKGESEVEPASLLSGMPDDAEVSGIAKVRLPWEFSYEYPTTVRPGRCACDQVTEEVVAQRVPQPNKKWSFTTSCPNDEEK
jgi:hypothetical protein